jgi:ribonuclease P protein component
MERFRETHISTIADRPQPPPRFPCPHGYQSRSYNSGPSSRQRPRTTVRLKAMTTALFAVKRLKARREFLYVAKGNKAVRAGVVVQTRRRSGSLCVESSATAAAELDTPHCGAGFTATKKIGNAVTRNRAKRRLREAARLLLPLHGQAGNDYVFIARFATPDQEWRYLLDDVRKALVKLHPNGHAGATQKQA